MFTTGLGAVPRVVFATSTMIIGIPTGIKIFNWLGTMWGGSIRFTTAMYFAVSFIVLFTIGGISGVMHASPPVDQQQQDTYFIVAHLHYVLVGGAIVGLFAGLYYWWPKITGRLLGEGLGKLNFWLMFVGLNLTFFPMHFLGVAGMPRRIYTYDDGLGWEFWNLVASLGSFVLALGVLVFIVNVALHHEAPEDRLLESLGRIRPGVGHVVAAARTRLRRDSRRSARATRCGTTATTGLSQPAGDAGTHIHMPPPSYYPLIVSCGRAHARHRTALAISR